MNAHSSTIRIALLVVLVSVTLMTASGCALSLGKGVYKTEIGLENLKIQPSIGNIDHQSEKGSIFRSRGLGECGKTINSLGAAVK